MSTHKIIKELLDENLIGAKKEIEDLLYSKLGDHLNEMYVELAPTLLGEKKGHGKAKKKDHDGDGDGDFADIMIARMVKSGMSKEEAIEKTRKHNKKKGKEDKTEEMKEMYGNGEASDETNTKGDKTPQGSDNLRPDGAPKDEPGDISKKKKEILAAIGKSSGAANSGTDAY